MQNAPVRACGPPAPACVRLPLLPSAAKVPCPHNSCLFMLIADDSLPDKESLHERHRAAPSGAPATGAERGRASTAFTKSLPRMPRKPCIVMSSSCAPHATSYPLPHTCTHSHTCQHATNTQCNFPDLGRHLTYMFAVWAKQSPFLPHGVCCYDVSVFWKNINRQGKTCVRETEKPQ